MGSLNSGNFIIKFSKTELYAHSKIYNNYNSLYSVTADRDARRSNCSDKDKIVQQQGIIKY